ELPARGEPVVLQLGDKLVLTRALDPGGPAAEEDGAIVEPARVGCTLPAIFDHLRPGEPIWFDDGKIGGEVEAVAPDHALIRITHARASGQRLGAEKGINLPATALPVSALTDEDRQNLGFVARHADSVGLSFVRDPEQVRELRRLLDGMGAPTLGLILK